MLANLSYTPPMNRSLTLTTRTAIALVVLAGALSCIKVRPAGPGSPTSPQPRSINVCALLNNMKPCWENATKLLARIRSCGQLALAYGEGVQEEVARLGASEDPRMVQVATFACAGVCSLKRSDEKMSWSTACTTAATAMKCEPSVCPAPDAEQTSLLR